MQYNDYFHFIRQMAKQHKAVSYCRWMSSAIWSYARMVMQECGEE